MTAIEDAGLRKGKSSVAQSSVQSPLTNTAFASTRQSLSTSLRALQTNPASTSTSVPPLVPGLPDAFAQLLTTFRHTVTGLSLAFKPPITVPAAIAQLDKLSDQLGRIISCVVAASAGEAWDLSSLVEEWRDGVLTIAGEVDKYLDVLEEGARSDAGPSDNPYLLHTGMVWDSIDKLDKDLSRTEVQAVAKRWEGQKEVVKDAWNEFKEFLEDAGGEDGEGESKGEGGEAGLDFGDDDDEWGELEKAMAGGEMTAEEKARAEAVKPLLGLHQILHATVPRFLSSLSPGTSYRPLLQASSEFLGAFDTAIASMYPEQDEKEIEAALADLEGRSRAIHLRMGERSPNDQCQTFLDRWEDRLSQETATWHSRRLDLRGLGAALS